jgi:RNA polymerase primary sigma factor
LCVKNFIYTFIEIFNTQKNKIKMRQLKITKSITNRESASFDKYLQEIGKYELIDTEKEVELALIIRKSEDPEERKKAIHELTTANLRFVVSVSKQYQNQGLSLPDLINEGNLGLIKAAEKFDETRGFKFISYAVWWIRQSIMQAINEQSRLVRLPLNQVSSLSKYKKAVNKFDQQHQRKPSITELSEILDLPEVKIKELDRIASKHVSYDATFGDDSDGTLLDVIPDGEADETDILTEQESLRTEIDRCFKILTERERLILKHEFGLGVQKLSLEEQGEKFGLTRERVRQIREKALRRLRSSKKSALLAQYLGK